MTIHSFFHGDCPRFRRRERRAAAAVVRTGLAASLMEGPNDAGTFRGPKGIFAEQGEPSVKKAESRRWRIFRLCQ
jgi:hypothetical protein